MSAAEPSVRARVLVAGRVQGVWFRASTQEVALSLGLKGWVRNVDTGDVEAVFQGPRDSVEAALTWCRKGPPGARVERCDVSWEPPKAEAESFQIRRT